MGSNASKSNDDLVDYLVNDSSLNEPTAERAFRLVDRGRFIPKEAHDEAYRDAPYRDSSQDFTDTTGPIHLSAPCIYANALDHLKLQKGHSFLNIGSGTGYFSTVVGFIIGSTGCNHGIEFYENLVEFSKEKLQETLRRPEINCFDFGVPMFFIGNGLLVDTNMHGFYDRIYIGAAIDDETLLTIRNLLKVGGLLVAPVDNAMVCYSRLGLDEWKNDVFSQVTFATLRPVRAGTTPVVVPKNNLSGRTLQELCRIAIRQELMIKANTLCPVSMHQVAIESSEAEDDDAMNSTDETVSSSNMQQEAVPTIQSQPRRPPRVEQRGEEEPLERRVNRLNHLQRLRRAAILAMLPDRRDRELRTLQRRFWPRGPTSFERRLANINARMAEHLNQGNEQEDAELEDELDYSTDTTAEEPTDTQEQSTSRANGSHQALRLSKFCYPNIPMEDGIVEDLPHRDNVVAQEGDAELEEGEILDTSGSSLHGAFSMDQELLLEDHELPVVDREETPEEANYEPLEELRSNKRRRAGQLDSDSEPEELVEQTEQHFLHQAETIKECSDCFVKLLNGLKLPKWAKLYLRYDVSMDA